MRVDTSSSPLFHGSSLYLQLTHKKESLTKKLEYEINGIDKSNVSSYRTRISRNGTFACLYVFCSPRQLQFSMPNICLDCHRQTLYAWRIDQSRTAENVIVSERAMPACIQRHVVLSIVSKNQSEACIAVCIGFRWFLCSSGPESKKGIRLEAILEMDH